MLSALSGPRERLTRSQRGRGFRQRVRTNSSEKIISRVVAVVLRKLLSFLDDLVFIFIFVSKTKNVPSVLDNMCLIQVRMYQVGMYVCMYACMHVCVGIRHGDCIVL